MVGATVELPSDLSSDDLDVGGPLLVPGIGAQGGTVDDVRRVFGPARSHVLPSSSREILGAGPDTHALRAAVEEAVATFADLG